MKSGMVQSLLIHHKYRTIFLYPSDQRWGRNASNAAAKPANPACQSLDPGSRGEMDGALQRYAEALAFYRALGYRLGEAHTLAGIGQVKLVCEQQGEADRLLEVAVSIFQQIGSRYSIADSTGVYGWALRRAGQYDLARLNLLRAAELYIAIGMNDRAERYHKAIKQIDEEHPE
jgi:tetratricopeptide (TPR) repeat protein